MGSGVARWGPLVRATYFSPFIWGGETFSMLRRRWETDSRLARIAYATDNMVIYSPRTVVHDPAILLGKRADDRDRYRETERGKNEREMG